MTAKRYTMAGADASRTLQPYAPDSTIRQDLQKFIAEFGPNTGPVLFRQNITLADARRKFDATLPYAARLAALPAWLTLHDVESAMGLSHSLFTHWANGWMPAPENRGNTLRWSKLTIMKWISEGCPRSDGTQQTRLLEPIETERQTARR